MNSFDFILRFCCMRLVVSIFLLMGVFSSFAQTMLSFHSEWDDSFKEWEIVMLEQDSSEVTGSLDVRWQMNDDFSSYDFRIGEYAGTVEQVFVNDPANWTLHLGNESVSIGPAFLQDPSSWQLRSGSMNLCIKTRFINTFDDWIVTHPKYGNMLVYSETEGDARDWIVEDYFEDNVSLSMKISAIFAVIQASTPKF